MIKINLLAEKKRNRSSAQRMPKMPAGAGAKSAMLVAILFLGVATAGVWWWTTSSALSGVQEEHRQADAELRRLEEIRKKGEAYKAQRELLANKIDLITELKKRQEVPVHILDQVSKNLPQFLWLESLNATNDAINIAGKATTYNAVSNFYQNLNESGRFSDVTLGRTFEAQEGVSFSLTCRYVDPRDLEPATDAESETAGTTTADAAPTAGAKVQG